jgi:hypothetical protein
MKFQMGMRTIGNWVEAIHVKFWQRTCLYFVCVLSFCVKQDSVVMD